MSTGIRLRNNFKRGGRANQVPMAHHNTIATLLNGATIIGGEITLNPNGMVINPFASRGGGGAADLSTYCFGLTLEDDAATILAGEVLWGASVFSVGEASMQITDDYQYVGLEATFTGAALIGPSTNLDMFRSDATTVRCWLYQFRLIDGLASLHRIGKPPGNWFVGSEFAP